MKNIENGTAIFGKIYETSTETNKRNMKLGELTLVTNTKKRRSANKNYWAVHCKRGDEEIALLLTIDQMQDSEKRAKANPEDIPPLSKPSFLAKLFGRYRVRI